MRAFLFTVFAAIALSATAQAEDSYVNARYGYMIDIPDDFIGEGEAANGDGQMFRSSNGTQELRVFGGNALEGFEATVSEAMQFARSDGWNLSYERTTPSWASFSGTRNGMIVYARAIALCGGAQFASFELRYPERDLSAMHDVVERLVASLEATGRGMGC